MSARLRMLALSLAAVLFAAPSSAAAGDCAAYLQQAQKLNAKVEDLIGKALTDRVSTDAPVCKFRSEEWSIREEKHRAWCADKDSAAIDARLQKMAADLQACDVELVARRRAAAARPGGGADPADTPLPRVTAPPPPKVHLPPPLPVTPPPPGDRASRTRPRPPEEGTLPPCPARFDVLAHSRNRSRCSCSPVAMRGMPPLDLKGGQSVPGTLSVCHVAAIIGLVGPEGGIVDLARLFGNTGPGSSGAPRDSGGDSDFDAGLQAVVTNRGGDGTVSTFEAAAPPPPGAGPGLPPDPDQVIHVVAGTYGGNCRGVPHGNRTLELSEDCDGWRTCQSFIDFDEVPQPVVGCTATYVAEWTCGKDPNVHRTESKSVNPKSGSGGQSPTDGVLVTLSCQSKK